MIDIPGYEGAYAVTVDGKVWSYSTNRFLKQVVKRGGYLVVTLAMDYNHKYPTVHRLVAKAFIPNPDNKPCINHLDGNKTNNNVENLEWCTYKENMQHCDRLGLRKDELRREEPHVEGDR